MSPQSLSFAKLLMMSSAPAKSEGDARYTQHDPFIQSTLTHTISTPICIRNTFLLRRTYIASAPPFLLKRSVECLIREREREQNRSMNEKGLAIVPGPQSSSSQFFDACYHYTNFERETDCEQSTSNATTNSIAQKSQCRTARRVSELPAAF